MTQRMRVPAGPRRVGWMLLILPLVATECPSDRLYVVGHLHRYETTGSGTMNDRQERIRAMGRMGFGGTRLGFEWGLLEPEPGAYSWDEQDSIMAELDAAGLGVYGMIGYSPAWARPADARQTHRPIIDGSAALGDTAFAAFAAAVARRYRGRVDRWEIWNEPNIVHFWAHLDDGRNLGPDPVDYGSLFSLAADSILAANPDAVVSTAGLAPGPRTRGTVRLSGEPRGYPAAMFLDSLLALGVRPQAIAIHPYSSRPAWLRAPAGSSLRPENRILDETLDVLDRRSLDQVPVWITEWGVDRADVSSDEQAAAWFSAELRYLLCHPRVEFVTIYALADRGGGTRRYSLLDRQGGLTATGRALASTLAGWGAC